jgi:hypothetical protein
MNRKQLTLLLVLGLVIGGLGLYLTSRDRANYGESGQALGGKILPDFPMNDVAQIVIQDGTNDLHLVKDEGLWRVQERHGYPADYGDISTLLRKVWEIKAVQSEEVGPSHWPRLQVAEPGQGTNSGTRLEFKDATGKDLGTLVLGKKHMRQSTEPSQFGGGGWPDGRYLRVAGEPRVALVSDAFTEVETQPDRFLNKDFIKVEKLRAVSVTHPNATNAWALARETETGPWSLIDPAEDEKLDSTKTSSLNYLLSNPMFDDVVSPEVGVGTTGLDQPLVARLETFQGFTYTVKVGNKTDDEKYYVAVQVEGNFDRERVPGTEETEEDKERLEREFKEQVAKFDEKLAREQGYGDWVYLVSKWTVDALLKGRGELLESKTGPDPGTEDHSDHDHAEDGSENGAEDFLVPEFFE